MQSLDVTQLTFDQAAALIGNESSEISSELLSKSLGWEVEPTEVARINQLPVLEYARRVARAHRKAVGLLDMLARLQHRAGPPPVLTTIIDREEFMFEYYLLNRAVIFKGLLSDSPGVRSWSVEMFAEKFGDIEVEVSWNRKANSIDHELDRDAYRTKMLLSKFVALIHERAPTNEFYIRRLQLGNGALASLFDDLPRNVPFLTIDPDSPELYNFRIGPAGTITHLHHDNDNTLLGQFVGRKKLRLVPSVQLPRMSNFIGEFSSFNLSDADTLEYVRSEAKADVHEYILEPGDAVFLPVGWWHYLEALDNSVSVSFHKLARPEKEVSWRNTFWMSGPGIWRLPSNLVRRNLALR